MAFAEKSHNILLLLNVSNYDIGQNNA